MRTDNKAVLLLFDKDLEWTSFAVDNTQQGYNVFDPEGNRKGYLLKNAAGGLNEFNPRRRLVGIYYREVNGECP